MKPQPSISELLQAALSKIEEERNKAIAVLHRLGGSEVFEAAKTMLENPTSSIRATGVDILAQLGVPERSFPKETVDTFGALLLTEKSSDVLSAVGVGLSRFQDNRIVSMLQPLLLNESSDVRRGVAIGLSGYEDERAINALIVLSKDEDAEVRNWATFGLGSQIDTDSQEVRDALFERLNDDENEIRGEAFIGLANRKDLRAIPLLIKELSLKDVGSLAVEAAGVFGDTQFLPALRSLENWWDVDEELLAESIENCRREEAHENE